MGSATVQGQRWGTGPGYWAEVIKSEHELAGVAGVPEPQPGTGTLDRDGGEPGGAEDAAHAVGQLATLSLLARLVDRGTRVRL
jgi:hypothetical protein